MNGSLGRSSAHTGSEAENNVAAPTRAPPKNLRRDTALVGSANLFNIESSSAELTNQGLGSGNVAQCRAHCRVVFTLGCDVRRRYLAGHSAFGNGATAPVAMWPRGCTAGAVVHDDVADAQRFHV